MTETKAAKRILTAMLTAVSLGASPAAAWGPSEHEAVALVAQARLSPDALPALRSLLGPQADLDRVSACADGMMYTKGETFDCGGVLPVDADSSKLTQPWHYISLPIDQTVTGASLSGYCPDGTQCVVEQIRRNASVLADPKASKPQKQMALMFLVHLVADEHQPLHCADDHDRGGNQKQVHGAGKARNLHSLWDGMVRDVHPSAESLVPALEREIGAEDSAAWESGDFVSAAALESYEIAKEVIYPEFARDAGVNESYRSRMRPIAIRRLAMAGVRLGAILEQVLKQGIPAQRAAPASLEIGRNRGGLTPAAAFAFD